MGVYGGRGGEGGGRMGGAVGRRRGGKGRGEERGKRPPNKTNHSKPQRLLSTFCACLPLLPVRLGVVGAFYVGVFIEREREEVGPSFPRNDNGFWVGRLPSFPSSWIRPQARPRHPICMHACPPHFFPPPRVQTWWAARGKGGKGGVGWSRQEAAHTTHHDT